MSSKGGRDIPRESALDHIFGLMICNEGTGRDWLRHGGFNVTQGKNFDRSAAIGPWIVTVDELDAGSELTLQTRVNSKIRQQDATANLMFPFEALIAYLSTFATLSPGDIIVTGTPTGAGVRFDPPVWLKLAQGRVVRGHKIGLTSRAMQQAVGIDEPDYGFLTDDMFLDDAAQIDTTRLIEPKLEAELAFILRDDLSGPNCTLHDVLDATAYVTPALELLDARIERFDAASGRRRGVWDTFAEIAADSAIICGGLTVRPMDTVQAASAPSSCATALSRKLASRRAC